MTLPTAAIPRHPKMTNMISKRMRKARGTGHGAHLAARLQQRVGAADSPWVEGAVVVVEAEAEGALRRLITEVDLGRLTTTGIRTMTFEAVPVHAAGRGKKTTTKTTTSVSAGTLLLYD